MNTDASSTFRQVRKPNLARGLRNKTVMNKGTTKKPTKNTYSGVGKGVVPKANNGAHGPKKVSMTKAKSGC